MLEYIPDFIIRVKRKMKLIVQRVSEASVTVDGVVKGAIGGGYMVLVGCRFDDSRRDADYLARRLAGLRVFNDAEGKMNLSIEQTGGSVLLVSQFTLYADTRKGNRPGFTMGGDPAKAEELYGYFIGQMRAILGSNKVACGEFGAEMKVALVNEGPVTIELTSDTQPWRGLDSATTQAAKSIPNGDVHASTEPILKKIETDADIAAAFAIVSKIWPVCYKDIISPGQIDFMLARMYAPETIKRETAEGAGYFLVRVNGTDSGVISYELKPNGDGVVYLHKIYLDPALWGKGLGRWLLKHIEKHAKEVGAHAVELNVNKKNYRAIRAYERVGFIKKREQVSEIGNGFIMDDYVMCMEICK